MDDYDTRERFAIFSDVYQRVNLLVMSCNCDKLFSIVCIYVGVKTALMSFILCYYTQKFFDKRLSDIFDVTKKRFNYISLFD